VSRTRLAGAAILALVAASALAAPILTTHSPIQQFESFPHAPPMRPRIVDAAGRITRPFVYPVRLADRLERRFVEDRDRPMPIRWFAGGVIASVDESAGPWFPFGSDPLGRDVFARLLYGTRLSLALALLAAVGALALGVLIGGTAGLLGRSIDSALMSLADFVLVLPAIFVVLVFRAALPLVLSVEQVFWALTGILIAAGWPMAARGVRSIVRSESRKEYAEAAYAAGAGRWRILLRHLLPATSGFLAVTGTLMVPAFVMAESTLSVVGLGFPSPTATWGTMLREASSGGAFVEAPWLMAPAALVVVTVLALHLVSGAGSTDRGSRGTFF
jgi:peptide/nickel transport system permease protein